MSQDTPRATNGEDCGSKDLGFRHFGLGIWGFGVRNQGSGV